MEWATPCVVWGINLWSGSTMGADIKVTLEKLSQPELSGSKEHGAVVDFWGVVREREKDQQISGIDYEAFVEMAESEMQKIVQAATEKFSIGAVILHHRIGFVPAGEVSLFLRVQASHRGPAFEASQWIVEQLKEWVPIWKHGVAVESVH